MVFAAGLGTRLRPLTNDRPKALVPVDGVPLLEITLRKLKYFGFEEVVVNIHHFGALILDFLEEKKNFGLTVHVSDERDRLLDTGGGLKNARGWFREAPFLVHNTDVITDLDLGEMYRWHQENDALATLAVRERESSRHLLFNDRNLLVGWKNNRTGETRMCRSADRFKPLAFSGIHVISPKLFAFMPEEDVFSIIDVYLTAGRTQAVLGYPHNEGFWFDVGKIPALEKAAPYVRLLPLANGP